MKKERLWLLLIILIAFLLRLTLLGRQSLWYDEGVTWLLSQMNRLSDLIQWTAADIQPPLYYLLMWAAGLIFGHSEWALRYPSAVFNTLTIPLIYVLARRLFTGSYLSGSLGPLLAAAIFALSPLMVYYSQEARMYSLLIFEASLASYLLLKILHPAHRTSRDDPSSFSPTPYSLLPTLYTLRPTLYTFLYVPVAVAALYTHYFAIFLLTAHALYVLVILRRRRWPKALIVAALQIFGLTALLFMPWLPTLLSRLGDDPSYWPGALKLDEAVRQVVISFTVGETVFEQVGFWLAMIFIGLLILAYLFSILYRYADDNSPLTGRIAVIDRPMLKTFLLLWLLLPPALILALSYQSPKFNPRYTLLAWPAFALLVAASLAGLWSRQPAADDQQPAPRPSPPRFPVSLLPRFTLPALRLLASRFLFSLTLLFILATSTFSLHNWFGDPRFSKDDFKALAQFVRERSAPDETVLLSSGHLFPVWAYYYGWQNWTPLPSMQRLDVNRVTDLTIAKEIAAAVEGKGGVWLVTWQDEVIDPNGVVPFWLDLIGRRPHDAGDFWGVGLEHWRLEPGQTALLHQNPIKQPARPEAVTQVETGPSPGSGDNLSTSPEYNPSTSPGYNFANQVELLGLTQLSDTELVLFWRPRQPLPDDLILSLRLTDPDGFDWGREDFVGRPGVYLYPPSRWPVGQVVMARQRLSWQTGTPPGLYIAEVGLGQVDQPAGTFFAAKSAPEFIGWDVLDEQGRPWRRTALLDRVKVNHLVQPENGPLPPDKEPLVDFWPIVAVRRAILPQKNAQAGDRVLLALLWQAGEDNRDDISVAFDLVDAAGQTFRVGSAPTPSRRLNLPRWHPGDTVLGQYRLDIPPEAAPGPADLKLHLINRGASAYDKTFPVGQLEILPTERNFRPPEAVDMPLEADFSGQAVLIGADCASLDTSACGGTPGQSIRLTLYWRAGAPFDKNYTVFTHLLGPDETVLVNADHAPPKPTQGWVVGEIIADPITLTLPASLPPGDYLIEVGLYDAADPTFQRLPLTGGDTRLILPQPLRVE